MRVGLAIETDSPGGAETMVLELAQELRTRGHEVVPLGFSRLEGWLTDRFAQIGIERQLLDLRGPFGLGSVSQIASTIRERRLEVLHSHEFGFAVCGALAARLTGCRHVITIHGGTYYSGRLRRRLALRSAMALSHSTVAVSHSLRETVANAIGVRTRSLGVVHNGVTVVESDGGDTRRELGVGPRDVLALAVGNLLEVKGHSFLLQAIAELPDLPARLVVAIAGRGHLESDLRSLADDLRIAQKVRFLGFRTDVADLLAGADVFVMPSLNEGLPMAMIEAMLAGKAIVASDVGGIPELIDTSQVGLLAPPEDAKGLANRLAEVVGDVGLRGRLGAAARARALEHFTASVMTEKYLRMYRA